MVTHKGASADSGHYIGWARKEGGFVPSGEEEWYKFDGEWETKSALCMCKELTARRQGLGGDGGQDHLDGRWW
jgi:hypothetical protein